MMITAGHVNAASYGWSFFLTAADVLAEMAPKNKPGK